MTKKTQELKPGQEVWLADGAIVEFVARSGSRFVVRPGRLVEMDDPSELERVFDLGVREVDQVYTTMPVRLYEPRIAELRNQRNDLESAVRGAQVELRKLKGDADLVRKRAETHPALSQLLLLLDGQITHIVSIRGSTVEVMGIQQSALSRFELDVPLRGGRHCAERILTRGYFSSLDTYEVILCTSEEQAQEAARQRIKAKVANIVKNLHGRTLYNVHPWITACKKYGVDVPPVMLEFVRGAALEKARAELSVTEQNAAKARATIAELTGEGES